jgi:predicted phage-related endonuclease
MKPSRERCETDRLVIRAPDARIIMAKDETALIRLWQEKRGELASESIAEDLVLRLDAATEQLNRSWYERETGKRVRHIGRRLKHPAIPWMVATLDGMVEGLNALFEAKFLPAPLSEEMIAEPCLAELQHKMWVAQVRGAVLSVITGNGTWFQALVPIDPLYLTVLVAAEKRFWRCVHTGEVPHLMPDPPRPRNGIIPVVGRVGSDWKAEVLPAHVGPALTGE